MEPPTTNHDSCRKSLVSLLWFTLCLLAVGWCLSAVAKIWVHLSWWKVFRRCVSIAAASALLFFLRYVHRRSIGSLGLGPWKTGRRQVIQGSLLGAGMVLSIGAAYAAFGIWKFSPYPKAWRVVYTVVGFLPVAYVVGVLEELIFRGYVLQQLLSCSRWLAVVGSSAAYALVHLRTMDWPGNALELVGLFLLGCVLAIGYLKTDQLYLSIGLHSILAYWARVNKLFVEITAPNWEWLVGGNRLVNGVIGWLALIAVGWIVARSRRMSAHGRTGT